MADTTRVSLGDQAASQLANVTKTAPIYGAITPRWLVRLLDWKPLEAGIFRRNRVVEEKTIEVLCGHNDESVIPGTYAEYEETPREYRLSSINALLNVDTRIGDLFSNPYDQVREQLRVTIESVKERQENELLNNADYGLLNNVPDSQRISTRKGAPTPDDLDELLTKVWKEPSFFIAHPRTIAAFGRECTRRGVPPPTVTLFGNPFLTWRGIPLIPTDKVRVAGKVPKSRISADPRWREKAGSHWALSTWPDRRTEPGAFRALHGNRRQRACVLPDFPLLLGIGAD